MMREGSDNSVELAANIVSAYISNNALPMADVANLISAVHSVVAKLSNGAAPPTPAEPSRPAVPVKKSVTDEFLICLEDGRKFKSLKRHLRTRYQLTPEQYRAKWQLPPDYPMVAPGYALTRSQMAKDMGLGQQRRGRKKR
jgi:predicted transcriptional regulator